ncbi:MAG: single-stranded DNA-binding protein [Candidatus Margulisiibacteriota bacterium]
MTSLNRIVLIGRLTDDPEIRVTTEGTSMTKFSLSVDRSFSQEDKADIISVVCWGKVAEQGTLFKKDLLVLVEGRIQVRSFEDKDGEKAWATEVVASMMKIMEPTQNPPRKGASKGVAPQDEMTEDDIPF